MKKNISADSPLHSQPFLSIKGSNSQLVGKKVEGFDKTATASSGFQSKIERIKNKPKRETL